MRSRVRPTLHRKNPVPCCFDGRELCADRAMVRGPRHDLMQRSGQLHTRMAGRCGHCAAVTVSRTAARSPELEQGICVTAGARPAWMSWTTERRACFEARRLAMPLTAALGAPPARSRSWAC